MKATDRRPRTSIRAGALLATCIAITAVAHGCRDATQVTLVISTTEKETCGGLRGIQLAVAGGAADAENRATGEFVTAMPTCANPAAQDIGTLVVTPGASGRMAVVVVAGIRNDARTCKPSNKYDGCVVARRSLSFRDHVSATVPIVLDPKCVDVPCDVSSTCNKGTCISSAVDCADDGSCESVDPRGRDGEDAGPGANDAASDGATDALADASGSDAPMTDGGGDAQEGGGLPGMCRTFCTAASGPCPAPTECCFAGTTNGMPVQACTTVMDCNAGGNGRMAGGVAECCKSTADCGGLQCCMTTDNSQTVCRPACMAGEPHICGSNGDCISGKCQPALLGNPFSSLAACQGG